jgi:hypothetical protein
MIWQIKADNTQNSIRRATVRGNQLDVDALKGQGVEWCGCGQEARWRH